MKTLFLLSTICLFASTALGVEKQVAECFNDGGLDMKIRNVYSGDANDSPSKVQISIKKFSFGEKPEFNDEMSLEDLEVSLTDEGAFSLANSQKDKGFRIDASIAEEDGYMVSRDSSIDLDQDHLSRFLEENQNMIIPLIREHSDTYCNYDMGELEKLANSVYN